MPPPNTPSQSIIKRIAGPNKSTLWQSVEDVREQASAGAAGTCPVVPFFVFSPSPQYMVALPFVVVVVVVGGVQ